MSSLTNPPSTSTEYHPKDPVFLHDLAAECFERHGLSGEIRGKDDVDQLILRLSEEFSLPLAESGSDHTQTLLDLTLALIYRFKAFDERGDIDQIIQHLRHLREHSLEALDVPYHAVTISLVEMLAANLEVKEEIGDTSEDINEIVAYCRGLASGISPVYLTNSLQVLTRAALDAYSRGKQLKVIDQAIEYLGEALKTYSPGSHQVQVSLNLSDLLTVRFLVLRAEDTYEEANLLLDTLTAPTSPWDPPCPYRSKAIALKNALGHANSIPSPNTGNSDATISSCHSFIDRFSLFGNLLHPIVPELMLQMVQTVQGFDPQQGASAQVAHSSVDPPLCLQLRSLGRFEVDGREVVQKPSSLTDVQQEIGRLEEDVESFKVKVGTEDQLNCIRRLVSCYRGKYSLTHDMTDIKDAIKWLRRLLQATCYRDSSRYFEQSKLGKYLFMVYHGTQTVENLNESITHHREVLKVEDAELMIQLKFVSICRLIGCLSSRLELPGHNYDLDEIMKLFASGVELEDKYATILSRFQLACRWVDAARISKHESLTIAYENAMSLMQSLLVLGATLPIKHEDLVENRDLYEKIPLNLASHYINKDKTDSAWHYVSIDKLKSAIETLEQGRALLWSEMHGLRISTVQLRTADPDLAEKIATTNKELEILATSTWSDGGGTLTGRFECEKQTLQYSELVARHKRHLKERDALISQIRKLPGFQNFLLPLSFNEICSASSKGPVIIINHSEFGSDILIVHNSSPSHIPTPYDFFRRVNDSKVKLLAARKNDGPDSENYHEALSFVLKELYELVGRPVIERFNKMGIREQSRVWWCPTSVSGYLPLHAMGPIPPNSGGLRYFSDLYISSYTPTLSALISSRRESGSDTQTPSPPTLLVAQSSPSPPGAWSDAQVIRDPELQTTSLKPGNTSPTTVLDGLQNHRIACIAYDGELEPGRPFEASLRFFNGGYLTLLDLVRSQHPSGEFALLPGSHTAELTEGSIPDEVLHLCAALQYSGYRSVIGTLWGLGDSVNDGQEWDLVKAVLSSMSSKIGEGDSGEPYYERSAWALQDAVQQMRHKKMCLARWVNYVHYGA